ncbi:MMPL family transporter [Candidatus Saccharibacteria bacterium]|nr:MMPL family transporter [Candidatus Saccharibacteria bacterium]
MGNFIVKHRKLILMLTGILLIPSIIGYFTTRVNYDMLNYLPDSMDTVIGQKELLDDFGKGAFSMIVTEDLPSSEQAKLEEKIKQIPHVTTVLGIGTIENQGIPSEILPTNLLETFTHDNKSIIAVFFDTSTSADETIAAINDIRGILDGHIYVGGMSALVTDLRYLAEAEEPIYVAIAVILALVVMFAFLDNWLAPILFLASIGVMIIINLGTNFIFGEISYITKALSAVLQLAVTMDYSIFLWHSYRENLTKTKDSHAAMSQAIKATVSSVFGSSATTIAGFIALCFMTFTLGLDLGLVMAKGVLLGVIGSVTVLPALILTFDKFLPKLDHRPLLPKFDKISNFITRFFPAFIVIFVALIPPFFYGYQQTNDNVYYTISDSLPADMEFAIGNRKLEEDFGLSNVHMILTSAKLSQISAINMTKELESVPGVKSVLNLESLTGDNLPLEILPESALSILKSDKWELTLVISEYKTASSEISTQIDDINRIIKSYDSTALLVGESSTTEDMIALTSVDFRTVNTISIVAIFIIIAIVTGSLSLPFILIAVIESAIFVNLGLPFFTGDRLSFITPICISTIQLGATVDYAILMTTRYKRERIAGQDKKSAAKIAITTSAPSIIVSGLGLFAATFGVSVYSNVDMIGSMCLLMARGAIISIIAVIAFLPPLLIFADPLIIRTTKGMKKLTKGAHQ